MVSSSSNGVNPLCSLPPLVVNVARPPVLTANHPWFISASDNPSTLLVCAPLTTSIDYHSWARPMCMPPLHKNKLGFVDYMYSLWESANVLVLSWLRRFVFLEIAQSVCWLDSARDVWLDLHGRF
ncbi:hypothetical protein LINGRAHAP2_LOCUS6422 [Linum grandiflorum]